MLLDRDLRFAGMNQAYLDVTQHRREDLIGVHVMDVFGADIDGPSEDNSQRLKASFEKVLETGDADHIALLHYPIRTTAADGQVAFDDRYWSCTHTPIKNDRGEVTHILQHTSDVTELINARMTADGRDGRRTALDEMLGGGIFRRAMKVEADNQRLEAERQKLMIDELNHRVKNTLATVQSIAMQTARSHEDPRSFAAAFQSRILSLSHTHDLLTRSHWEGADLRSVLEHETMAHGTGRLSLNGPHIDLSPARAVSLGMVFHELATNAAKYGALSRGDGRVIVDWRVADQKAPRLEITWREVGGGPIAAPERRGFGTRLIERNVRHDLHGDVKMSFADDGFRAEFNLPLETNA
ncbi:hypothetical protein EGK63_10405 [Brevundimonas sp. 357]|nr:hypothetical protein EGK63_10405 [Brevundimonas sp. 357]